MKNSKRINRIAHTLCFSNWIFGLGVIQYPLGTRHPTISSIYSTFCVISYCAISAVAYPYMLKWSEEMGKMSVSIKLLFYSNIILTVSAIALARYRSEGTFNSIKKAMMVNDLLERISVNMNDEKMRIAYVGKLTNYAILVTVFIAVHAALITMKEGPSYAKISFGISLCYPVVIMFIADMTFVIRVSVIGRKYEILNETLKSAFKDEPDIPRHTRLVSYLTNEDDKLIIDTISHTVDDPTNLIKLAKEIHLELLKLSEEINNTYGLQILLSIVVAFAVITGNIYVSYMLLQDGSNQRNMAFRSIIHSTVWTLYYAIKISNFPRACSRCKQNAIETGDLLNKFYDDSFANEDVQREIRDFNVQLIQRPLNFTAAGYISLDTCLCRMMISTIITYLMILVELGKVQT